MDTIKRNLYDGDWLAGWAAFASVTEAGSFSEAARRMGTSKSALSKQVRRLELHLGAKLLQRTTRSLSLTEPGRLAYEHATQVARSAANAEAAVATLTGEPRGLLRVTTSMAYGKTVLLSLLADFLKRYPAIDVDVLLLDRIVDLAHEGIDVAVRLTDTPPDLSVARPLRPIDYWLVASRDFRDGVDIQRPADLEQVNVLNYARGLKGATWTFRKGEQAEQVKTRGRASVNSSEGLLSLVADGVGVAVVPDYLADRDLKRRRLVRLLPKWSIDGHLGNTVWIVRLPDRAVLPAVRAFSAFLVERLQVQGAEGGESSAPLDSR